MNQIKQTMVVLAIALAFSSMILGLGFGIYELIKKEYINMPQGIGLIIIFNIAFLGLLIFKAKR